jgi:outer membrane protein
VASDRRRVAGNEPEEVSIARIQPIIECSIFVAASRLLLDAALGQCAGKVSSPAAVADCAARETPREGTAILDPVRPYTLAELIEVAEHHNPSTRTIWEGAKQKARELGLAKSAYYPE